MTKKLKPNQIREETRKKMAAKYKVDIATAKENAKIWHDRYFDVLGKKQRLKVRMDRIEKENARLKEVNDQQKDWIERLLEFAELPEQERKMAVTQYFENMRKRKESEDLLNSFMRVTNRLFMFEPIKRKEAEK